MSTNPTPSATPEAAAPIPPARPRTVDWAVYAIFIRCVFSLASGLLLFPYHNELLRREHDLFPKLTDAQVHQAVGSAGVGLFGAVLSSAVLLVLGKYIRDGRNWARWAFAVVSVLIFKDIYFILLPFVHGYPPVLAIVAAISGVAAFAAIVLMFLRPSMQYFRETTNYNRARRGMPEIASPLTAMFRPRSARPAGPTATPTAPTVPSAPTAPTGSNSGAAAGTGEPRTDASGTSVDADGSVVEPPAAGVGPAKRLPRPKSRRGPVE